MPAQIIALPGRCAMGPVPQATKSVLSRAHFNFLTMRRSCVSACHDSASRWATLTCMDFSPVKTLCNLHAAEGFLLGFLVRRLPGKVPRQPTILGGFSIPNTFLSILLPLTGFTHKVSHDDAATPVAVSTPAPTLPFSPGYRGSLYRRR
jgi:hypothetical protein